MKVDIAIITIRPDEFKAVRSRFETEERHIPGGRTYLIGEVKTQDGQTYTIAIARCSDQGNDTSQRLAHSIIHHLDPQLILVVGIAGGIPHDDFTLGDVVLSTRIVNPNVDAWHADGDTDYIMRGGPPHPLVESIISLLPGKPQLAEWAASIQPQRPDLDPERVNIKGDDEWREKVRESLKWHFREEENRGRSSTYIAGPILSSNHLMKDPARLGVLLKTHRDIFAVEMEVAGVYEAAYGTPHYPVMAIRGISDIVGLQRDRRWTAYACQAAAAFTHAFIMTNPLKLQTAAGCPYRGLDAFTENDHKFFFGRQRDIDRLLHKFRGGSHFMAVLGPSGGGKSSLIQAGLIRKLRDGSLPGSANWEFITSRPANDPFEHLAAKGFTGTSNNLLERAQTWRGRHPEKERLVLVLDQFEELWTSCSPELAYEFVMQLTQLLKAPYHEYITIIVIMRDDFYRYSVQNEQFAGLMEQGTVNILPKLRRGEFFDIIQKPADIAGLRFADGLVDTIVEDVLEPMRTPLDDDRYGPNTILPLLEFALTALWNECKRRQGEELMHSDYITIQGVSGALALWAEKAYQRIEERLQPLARHIFTNLVYLNDEKRGLPKSRIRRTLGELHPVNSTPNDVQQVVHQLATERLLVASRDTGGQEWVEIIHDVLLEKWESLRKWLDEDRPFLSWHQELQRRFQLWVETDPTDPLLRDEGRLLRGRDLEEAEHWMAERGISFDQMEQDFITISRKHVERQRQALIARQLAAQAEVVQPTFRSLIDRDEGI